MTPYRVFRVPLRVVGCAAGVTILHLSMQAEPLDVVAFALIAGAWCIAVEAAVSTIGTKSEVHCPALVPVVVLAIPLLHPIHDQSRDVARAKINSAYYRFCEAV